MLMPASRQLTAGRWRAPSFGGNWGYFDKATRCLWTKCHKDTPPQKKTVSAVAVKAKQNARQDQRDDSVSQGQMEHSGEISGFNSQAHLGKKRFEKEWPVGTSQISSLLVASSLNGRSSRSEGEKKTEPCLSCCDAVKIAVSNEKHSKKLGLLLALDNNQQPISQTALKIVRITTAEVCFHRASSTIRNSALDGDLLQFSLRPSRWRSSDEGQSRREAGGALIKRPLLQAGCEAGRGTLMASAVVLLKKERTGTKASSIHTCQKRLALY